MAYKAKLSHSVAAKVYGNAAKRSMAKAIGASIAGRPGIAKLSLAKAKKANAAKVAHRVLAKIGAP